MTLYHSIGTLMYVTLTNNTMEWRSQKFWHGYLTAVKKYWISCETNWKICIIKMHLLKIPPTPIWWRRLKCVAVLHPPIIKCYWGLNLHTATYGVSQYHDTTKHQDCSLFLFIMGKYLYIQLLSAWLHSWNSSLILKSTWLSTLHDDDDLPNNCFPTSCSSIII